MTELKLPDYNTGVLEGSGTKQLWAGGTIPYEVRLESGDWRPFVPTLEKQKDPIETFACVTFSHNNALETQYKFFGIDVNFSDRFLAKMSGTTQNGNWCDRVADTARTIGLVLESEWPNNPKAQSWDEYYKEIPQEIKNKAVKQPIQYESISTDIATLKYHLKQSPIQITIPGVHPYHAVCLVHIDNKNMAYYLDHYNMQIGERDATDIATALKIVLNKSTTMTNSLIVKNGSEFGIYDPATSEDGLVTLMRNRGIPVPLTADGKLDWSKVKVDKQLV